MFRKHARYSLIAITGVALIGCSAPTKTITIKPNTQPIIGGARTVRHQAPIIIDERVVTYPQETVETRVEVPSETISRVEEPIVEPRVTRVEPRVEPRIESRVESRKEPRVESRKEPREEPKVIVPQNHPTIGIQGGATQGNSATARDVDRLNGQVMDRMPFPLDEYRSLKKIGRSTVSGRVYITNSITDKEINGSGLKLYLNPVTSYSTQWYNESYLSGYKMSKVDRRLYNYLKFSTSNSNGKFDFFGIPKGKYYLIGSMMCGEECGLSSPEKIRLVKEIYVGSGVTKVDLTKRVP